ncbi:MULTISPECIES: arsenate reductase/protein-tyrosine-phosphatase family protein [Microbacterium]|uniref:arsenate reductase/protein-tyrosine-phosphatase family protein n=1 Tax=Microbacterium TaxID=33882 RepID=UPI000376842E|nr:MULTISPECIES: low molecular weight phosphatase family protein [unclassified Microbacterium]MDT3346221.1 low molecular weight phosphatase family protein [Microbacterium sp. KSW2-22]SDG72143.1 protein-tyrosine phosphatase [Microbacterium sp. 77mftsu3.1]
MSRGIRLEGLRVIQILTVCTGNICRSPLAALVLQHRLGDLGVAATSAGVRARQGDRMPREAVELAVAHGVPTEQIAGHGSRYLTEALLREPDLVLAMDRDHRRAIVELAPAKLRTAFTIREFERLAAATSDDAIRAGATGDDPRDRLRGALAVLAGQRGLVLPPVDPTDDDVVDPYGRSRETYARSDAQLSPGLDAVERVVRLAVG